MMNLTLVTPEKRILTDAEIDELVVPAHRGELNILPGHSPVVTTLGVGVLRYRLKGENEFHNVVSSWGYLEVSPKGIFVLAETAETLEEIDKARAEKALAKAQKEMVEADLQPNDIQRLQKDILKAEARINALH